MPVGSAEETPIVPIRHECWWTILAGNNAGNDVILYPGICVLVRRRYHEGEIQQAKHLDLGPWLDCT